MITILSSSGGVIMGRLDAPSHVTAVQECFLRREYGMFITRLLKVVSYVYGKVFGVKMPKYICSNCGIEKSHVLMTHCRMVDRCIPSQNLRITLSIDHEELVRKLATGERIYVDVGAPLCYRCAQENQFTCYHCELEAMEERK